MARILGRANSEPSKHDRPATSEESQRVTLQAPIFHNNLECQGITVRWRRRPAGDFACSHNTKTAGGTPALPLFLEVFHGLAAERGFRRSRGVGAAVILELRVGDGVVSVRRVVRVRGQL